MQRTEHIMGMPITITTVKAVKNTILDDAFDRFRHIDARYSTYKSTSEISHINAGLPQDQWSAEMKEIMRLCELTKAQTHGYFNIEHNGQLDPSGLVKGWAIQDVAKLLHRRGVRGFSVEAGGDIQVSGDSPSGAEWRIGIRNPFDRTQNVKIVGVRDHGVATSGTYIRGQHVYNPHTRQDISGAIVSLTVIGSSIYDADRFATAAFAMGEKGISFIEELKGFEGYMIDKDGIATMTSGFTEYVR